MDILQAALAVVVPLARWLWGRVFPRKQVSVETYEAKSAEAKALAQPDRPWDDTVRKL